ncbi:MAG: hypothetical protein EBT21_05475, partial [Actinobacteria bacterium]|nr:hypothetical protein [Actinomycetota bacterium]
QVRAMMKASAGLDNLRIMLPMISNVAELDEALALLRRVSQHDRRHRAPRLRQGQRRRRHPRPHTCAQRMPDGRRLRKSSL